MGSHNPYILSQLWKLYSPEILTRYRALYPSPAACTGISWYHNG